MTELAYQNSSKIGIRVSQEFVSFLSRMRIINNLHRQQQWAYGDIVHALGDLKLEPYVGIYAGYHLPEMGSFSYSFSELPAEMRVGRYCSISWDVKVLGISHPIHFATTSAITYEDHPMFQDFFADMGEAAFHRRVSQRPAPQVGHDVWIGQDVKIARGVSIGNGACVAGGALVTKDVPPYAVVGGSPAKILKYRFDDRHIEQLQSIGWWNYAFPRFSEVPVHEPDAFIEFVRDGISRRKLHRIRPLERSLQDLVTLGELSATPSESLLFLPDDASPS